MPKPIFCFSEHNRYYEVKVENLEFLSVEQIKQIEEFVKFRRGIFDFNSYSFYIQKKLSYEEFVKVMQRSSLDVITKQKELMLQEQPRVGFGQYKGLFYSDLPDSYMLWLKSNYKGYDREKVEEELKRRGL